MVIHNMRSAGRMLLYSSVFFPAFERVSIVLSTSADPSTLVILDCAGKFAPVRDCFEFGRELSSRLLASCGRHRAASERAVTRRLPKPSRNVGAKGGRESPERTSSGAQSGGDSAVAFKGTDEARADERGASHEIIDAPSGGRASESRAAADGHQPVIGRASDLDALLKSHSLVGSMLYDGAMESDAKVNKVNMTSGMMEHFLRCSGLLSLDALFFTMCSDIWRVEMELKNDTVAVSGVQCDWRSL